MRYGSLFAGIGGLDLGLDRAGFECAWQIESNPYCKAVLKRHWPLIPRYGDIAHVDPDQLSSVQLVCGGFPCQPVSQAGLRRGAGWWSVEPRLGRVADGVPARVDRLRALGNSVVPQLAEWIGRRILEREARCSS